MDLRALKGNVELSVKATLQDRESLIPAHPMPLSPPVTSHNGTALVALLDVPEVALAGALPHPLTHARTARRCVVDAPASFS